MAALSFGNLTAAVPDVQFPHYSPSPCSAPPPPRHQRAYQKYFLPVTDKAIYHYIGISICQLPSLEEKSTESSFNSSGWGMSTIGTNKEKMVAVWRKAGKSGSPAHTVPIQILL